MKQISKKKLNSTKILIIAVFIVLIVLPLFRMLAFAAQIDLSAFLSSPALWRAVVNSITVSAVATFFSVSIAMILAFCITRSQMKFKGLFAILITIPMLIPSISHGIGIIIMFGANGIITNLFNLPGSIYGFNGIVLGSVMYTFPIAYLMISDILSYEDTSVYDAATILGIPKWKQFVSITLPYLTKPLIAVVFATFTAIVTDYGVPIMVGGLYTTLPVMMYHEVIGRLNFGRGSVIGAILLLPAVVSFIIDTLSKNTAVQNFVTQSWRIRKNTIAKIFSTAYCSIISIAVLLPILSFVILTVVQRYPIDMTFTLANIARANNQGAGGFLINSLFISVMVTCAGVITSYLTAYLTARFEGKLSRIMHLLSLTTIAIPGIVLGISYAIFFRGSLISGTFSILILVNIVHFFASPYLIAYNSLSKINPNLESVGMTLGVSRFRTLIDVILPQTRRSIAEMSLYFFVNSMMTISAVSFLNTTRTRPLSLMIPMYEGQMQLESAAVVSLAILIVNLIMKGFVGLAKKRA